MATFGLEPPFVTGSYRPEADVRSRPVEITAIRGQLRCIARSDDDGKGLGEFESLLHRQILKTQAADFPS